MTAHDFLIGMKGGDKHMWLRNHWDLVRNYCETFGLEEGCKEFYTKREVLERLFKSEHREVPYTVADRALDVSKMNHAGIQELRGRINQVEGKLDNIEYEVAHHVADLVLKPWIAAAQMVNKDLEEKRRLRDIRIDQEFINKLTQGSEKDVSN
jgi:hypothetical protein